jgi:hypothetical protein
MEQKVRNKGMGKRINLLHMVLILIAIVLKEVKGFAKKSVF